MTNKPESFEVLPVQVTTAHLLGNLSTEMYKDPTFCLKELVRNSIAASISNNVWEPKNVQIEIFISNYHPLTKTKSLIFLDHGVGFTDENIKRFCLLGPSQQRIKERKSNDLGLSQKGIGRFAALALSQDSFNPSKYDKAGFYILTRTKPEGDVTVVEVLPKYLENGYKGFPKYEIPEFDINMQDIDGIRGSFSAIIIPNPVLTNADQIREAIQWALPRKRNHAISVKIDGRLISAPPLATKLPIIYQDVEGYFELNPNTENQDGGVYLCDAKTSLRVCPASEVGYKHIPSPLWSPLLKGDVFIEGLLTHQDTSRSTLSPEYLKSAEWLKNCGIMELHFKRQLENLLGVEPTSGSNKITEMIDEVIQAANSVFGLPEGYEEAGGNRWKTDSERNKREIKITPKEKGEEEISDTDLNKIKKRTSRINIPGNRQQIQTRHIKIGNTVFTLIEKQLPQYILFEPHPFFHRPGPYKIIYMNNPEAYGALASTANVRKWQVFYELCGAVAQIEHGDNTSEMRGKQTEYTTKLFAKKK